MAEPIQSGEIGPNPDYPWSRRQRLRRWWYRHPRVCAWRRRIRRSDAQLMASVHTPWWWMPGVAKRYADGGDRG